MNQYLELREYMMYLIIKKYLNPKLSVKLLFLLSLLINEMFVVYLQWMTAGTMGVYAILSMVIWWLLSFFPIIVNFTATSILNSQNWLWNRRSLFQNYHTSKRHHFEDILDFHVPVLEGRWLNYHSSVEPVKPSNLTLTNSV